jgi:hypothetical protein
MARDAIRLHAGKNLEDGSETAMLRMGNRDDRSDYNC